MMHLKMSALRILAAAAHRGMGRGCIFSIFSLNFCRMATKMFWGKVLDIWGILPNVFDSLSVSHEKKGRVKIKRPGKSYCFAKMTKF